MTQISSLRSQPETWRAVLKSSIERLLQLGWDEGEIFELHEQCSLEPDADGVGVWIAVASLRHEALLEEIRQSAFRRFDFVESKIENCCYWAHLRPSSTA